MDTKHIDFAKYELQATPDKPKRKLTKEPSIKTMEKWMNDSIAKATDGCRVEPDGTCQHGCNSWLIELGLI